MNDAVMAVDDQISAQAAARQDRLTKPTGSLGRLEELAIRLAGLQHTHTPEMNRPHIAVFAADHGVATEGVSAFPQEVTAQMVANFASGGAAVSVLARELGASLEVIDVGTLTDGNLPKGVVDARVARGSCNIRYRDAMSPGSLAMAMNAGKESAERAAVGRAELFIGGEMGIGNTTAATALVCGLLGAGPVDVAGPGTGLGAEGIRLKIEVVERALARLPSSEKRPLDFLRILGGLEIAALVGAYIRAAQLGIPVLVDGFITTAAALTAVRSRPDLKPWLLFSHRSAEPGHQVMLEALDANPLLALEMRLGEGSGAAVAVPLLRAACALHNSMATFTDAGVSEN